MSSPLGSGGIEFSNLFYPCSCSQPVKVVNRHLAFVDFGASCAFFCSLQPECLGLSCADGFPRFGRDSDRHGSWRTHLFSSHRNGMVLFVTERAAHLSCL